ncbi:MAG TPA: DUF4157 domain-containing protein [Actinomycetota bacterium]|nr:DUF4157 domain-containing protein [Actinomycetota bacterium]
MEKAHAEAASPGPGAIPERTSPVPASAEAAVSTPGEPLAVHDRAPLEGRLGHDFGRVRVHRSPEAAAAADGLGAVAFTVGEHVVFGPGRFAPATSAGRALLAHELGHVVEQRTGARPREVARQPQTAPPPELAPNPYQETPQEALHRLEDLAEARESILEALRRSDAIDFLNRLRRTSEATKAALLGDTAFLAEVHRVLRGLAYWTVLLILKFGNLRPADVSQLYMATSFGEMQRVLDLVRANRDLRDEAQVPGTRQMLDEQLRGNPLHDRVLSVFDDRRVSATGITTTTHEAHFDRPTGGGAPRLLPYGGTVSFSLERTSRELRVLVRILLVKKPPATGTYYPSDAKMTQWRGGIQQAWNGRFTATNGTTHLDVVFVPMFVHDVAEGPDYTVEVDDGTAYQRADVTHWWVGDSADTVAHEFGHMVGNPDEYGLPAHASDIPASMVADPAERRRSSQEGLPAGTKTQPTPEGGREAIGLMGRHSATSRAELRHGWLVLQTFNANLQPGEAGFHLEVH